MNNEQIVWGCVNKFNPPSRDEVASACARQFSPPQSYEIIERIAQDLPLSLIQGGLMQDISSAVATALCDDRIKDLESKNEALKSVLKDIKNSLPVNRDWLDPVTEKMITELLK